MKTLARPGGWQCVLRSSARAPACRSCTAASAARRSGPRSGSGQRRPAARGGPQRAAPGRAPRPPRDRGHCTETLAWRTRKISNTCLSTGWFPRTIALELCDRTNVYGMGPQASLQGSQSPLSTLSLLRTFWTG